MDTSQPTTIVLGAGVVGLSTALYLQRSGHHVTVIDPLPPAGGASYGNAGLISSDTAVPIARPGMLRKVPGWLADREGPLVVRPSYFPRALPWLLRWIETSRMSRVLQIYPEIAPGITKGLLIPGNAYTVSPQRLVQTLGKLLVAAGGELIAERAMKIIPKGGAEGFMVMTNLANRAAQRIVVATGAWTRELLDPLGIKVPLETERGYHAMKPSPNITLRIPMSIKNRGFGLTSMEDGLRVGGTVEIGGLRAPPDERRGMLLVGHVKRIFPTLQTGEPSYWMGIAPRRRTACPSWAKRPAGRDSFSPSATAISAWPAARPAPAWCPNSSTAHRRPSIPLRIRAVVSSGL